MNGFKAGILSLETKGRGNQCRPTVCAYRVIPGIRGGLGDSDGAGPRLLVHPDGRSAARRFPGAAEASARTVVTKRTPLFAATWLRSRYSNA